MIKLKLYCDLDEDISVEISSDKEQVLIGDDDFFGMNSNISDEVKDNNDAIKEEIIEFDNKKKIKSK